MFTHVMVGTNDADKARAFYDATFAELGVPGQHTPNGAWYGDPEAEQGMFGVVTPRNEDIVEKLDAFAKARDRTMLELAFSWLASRPQVSSVIAGATRVEQIEANVKAIDWALTADELTEIDTLTGAA